MVTFCVLITSCDFFTYKKQFDDTYYDNNYIAQIGFDKFIGNSATVPAIGAAPQVGLWDFAYRYLDWDGYPYMTLDAMSGIDPAWATPASSGFVAAGETVPAELSSSASVFRLELKNLIGGGDFEGFADTAALNASGQWSTPSSNLLPCSADLLNTGGIDHNSVLVTIPGLNNPIIYTINPIAAQFTTGSRYILDFRWAANGNSYPPGDNNKICINGSSGLVSFNATSNHAIGEFIAGATNRIVFESSSWECTIDDITVKKIGNLQLRLLLHKDSTTPSLKDFLYKFSFWIHADTSVGASTSPYHLDRMGISMSPTKYSTMSTKSDADYQPSRTRTRYRH